MRSVVLALACLGALYTSAASAGTEVMSAGDLQQLCSGTDHVSVNVCRVYILGVAQGVALGLGIAGGKVRNNRPCVPDAVSGEDLEQTLKARLGEQLAAHPGQASHDAAAVLAAVLARAYPCGTPR